MPRVRAQESELVDIISGHDHFVRDPPIHIAGTAWLQASTNSSSGGRYRRHEALVEWTVNRHTFNAFNINIDLATVEHSNKYNFGLSYTPQLRTMYTYKKFEGTPLSAIPHYLQLNPSRPRQSSPRRFRSVQHRVYQPYFADKSLVKCTPFSRARQRSHTRM